MADQSSLARKSATSSRSSEKPAELAPLPRTIIARGFLNLMVPASLNVTTLGAQAAWIRDVLDPQIAQEGPDFMSPEDVLLLSKLFNSLQRFPINTDVVRQSRIHKAVLLVSGKATRWPATLVDECDKIILKWEAHVGPLARLTPLLYESGGRLRGISLPERTTNEGVLRHWKAWGPAAVDPARAMVVGAMGLKPGDWWINAMFALHQGVISFSCVQGGIAANKDGVYAVVMRDQDEEVATSFDTFTYRCRPENQFSFLLRSADHRSRQPMRIFRSHLLSSPWAPSCGLRYEGLYRVIGWHLLPRDPVEGSYVPFVWHIHLQRDPNQTPIEKVMLRPFAAERDDYEEFVRLRKGEPVNLVENARDRTDNKTPSQQSSSSQTEDIDFAFPIHAKAEKVLGLMTPRLARQEEQD